MDHTYKENEIEFARHIKKNPPNKIWWDFTNYVFDYGDFYFRLESVSEIADTQNKSDEAIIGQFTKNLEPYLAGQYTKLVCENKKIDDMYVVRTFLHFTTFREYSKTEQLFNQTKQKVKSLVTGKTDVFEDIASKAIGGSAEITCHPKSDQVKKVDPRYSNLIDCGLLLIIEGKCLKVFVENNGFGFHFWNDKYFFDINELNRIAEHYELIKI
jgi:hypothetical protein